MKKFFFALTFLILFFNSFYNLSAEENSLTLKQQLDRLQREVNDLSKLAFQNPAGSNQNNDQTVNFAAIDIRIYDLEKDIKYLTMTLEELTFQIDEIINNVKILEENLQTELENLVSGKDFNSDNSNTQINEEVLIEQNTENSLGTLKITSSNDENLNNQNQEENVDLKNDNINEDLSPEDQFQLAFDSIRNKKYNDAINSFRNFIDNNPDNQLSGSAHYWLGELYLLEKKDREAALILAEGYQNFPKSIKSPDMLYKLSEALINIEKNQEACNTLDKLSKDFPSHKLKKKSDNKKIEIGCEIVSQ